ncbi:MAG: hypothetical protein ACPH4K_08530 [Flavobacteriaceae bacterium]
MAKSQSVQPNFFYPAYSVSNTETEPQPPFFYPKSDSEDQLIYNNLFSTHSWHPWHSQFPGLLSQNTQERARQISIDQERIYRKSEFIQGSTAPVESANSPKIWRFPTIKNDTNGNPVKGFTIANETEGLISWFDRTLQDEILAQEADREVEKIMGEDYREDTEKRVSDIAVPPTSPVSDISYINQATDRNILFRQEMDHRFNNCVYQTNPWGAIGSRRPNNTLTRGSRAFDRIEDNKEINKMILNHNLRNAIENINIELTPEELELNGRPSVPMLDKSCPWEWESKVKHLWDD